MGVFQREIQLHTSGHRHMHEITRQVQAVVDESGIATGLAHIFNVGSTGTFGLSQEFACQDFTPALSSSR